MAAEVIEGQTSLSEFVCGAAALWFEAGSAACNFYHDLCAPLPSVGGSGVVFFEIDPLSQCADPFALGNVRASDLPDLWSSELSCSPPGPSITADKVRLSTYRDDVLVSLINLPTSQFQVGQIYEGRIKRSSDGSFVAAIIVKVVSEIE
jgi:hypothetical protein